MRKKLACSLFLVTYPILIAYCRRTHFFMWLPVFSIGYHVVRCRLLIATPLDCHGHEFMATVPTSFLIELCSRCSS
jgi:hypothetical protein